MLSCHIVVDSKLQNNQGRKFQRILAVHHDHLSPSISHEQHILSDNQQIEKTPVGHSTARHYQNSKNMVNNSKTNPPLNSTRTK